MDELAFSTVGELATAIQQHHVSAAEVVEEQLARIARQNPKLNAVVTIDDEGARRRARRADEVLARGETWGPLHGVPITIKDSLQTAGLRTTSGLPLLADYVPARDATVVMRLRRAGAIILGKTNLPTLGSDSQTHNPLFGRTNNPWDPTRTPGGSTGGGAAAVAAGLTPLEIGSDWGGSVRVPAHYCGVYALKPTEHRVPWTGHIPPIPGSPWGLRHLAVIGPLARSVNDLSLALRVISGPDGSDSQVPPVPLSGPPECRLDELRVAWTDDFAGQPVTADTRRALANLAGELERLGCRTERCGLDGFDLVRSWEIWGEIRQTELGSAMAADQEVADAERFKVSLDSEVPWLRGRARVINATMRQYTAILTERDALIAGLEQFFQKWDVLLCPVSMGPAFPHCPTGTAITIDGRAVPYWLAAGVHCMPFNTTGHPAVVMPLQLSAEGLPIGVQLVGRLWDEMKLLSIASLLAEVIGPFRRPPGY